MNGEELYTLGKRFEKLGDLFLDAVEGKSEALALFQQEYKAIQSLGNGDREEIVTQYIEALGALFSPLEELNHESVQTTSEERLQSTLQSGYANKMGKDLSFELHHLGSGLEVAARESGYTP